MQAVSLTYIIIVIPANAALIYHRSRPTYTATFTHRTIPACFACIMAGLAFRQLYTIVEKASFAGTAFISDRILSRSCAC